MGADRSKRWERAEMHLRAALAEADLPEMHRELVTDFVDRNELGLAFAWIVETMLDHGLAVSKRVRRHLAAAAAELGLRANRDWQRLHAVD